MTAEGAKNGSGASGREHNFDDREWLAPARTSIQVNRRSKEILDNND